MSHTRLRIETVFGARVFAVLYFTVNDLSIISSYVLRETVKPPYNLLRKLESIFLWLPAAKPTIEYDFNRFKLSSDF